MLGGTLLCKGRALLFPFPNFIVSCKSARGCCSCGGALLPPHSLLQEFSRQQSYGSVPERGTYFLLLCNRASGIGGEGSSCCDKMFERAHLLQPWAHFQKSSNTKRFLEECRLLSIFWCQTLREANFITQYLFKNKCHRTTEW